MKETIQKATYGSPERPLKIAGLEIPCYVLENGESVVVLSGMLNALDIAQGTAGRGGGNRLSKFVCGKNIKAFLSDEFIDKINHPIKFRTTRGSLAYGYEATILADLCEAVLKARDKGILQKHIAIRCEILVRGFTRVGIIGKVKLWRYCYMNYFTIS